MKKQVLSQPVALIAGIALVFPTLYFIVSAVLHYQFGAPMLWSVIEPIFENPENKSFGWNINLLILFGPVLAILLNLSQVVKVVLSDPLHVDVHFQIKKHGWSWLVILAAGFCLASLFIYMIGENCR